MPDRGDVTWRDGAALRRAAWWSETTPLPTRVGAADDRTTADAAFRRARSGEALVYGGDWHNARQLLAAMGRRLVPPRPREPGLAGLFRAERALRRAEHEVLSRLAVPLDPGWRSPLRRAPPLDAALAEAFGPAPERAALLPLREVLGAVGAHEWQRKGVPVPALGASVHPFYGVFAPVRGEYVDLAARALAERPPPGGALAFDVGTGTGVLAALLARAGCRVVASDIDGRAAACARENLARLGVGAAVEVQERDLFPDGEARLVVANPPWLPAEPHGALDRAVYDPGGTVLARLVEGLPAHLAPDGEAWLILSDLAELLGLRAQGELAARFAAAGLEVRATLAARPSHPRARDASDPLAAARARERTTLYVLGVLGSPARRGPTIA
ncbi:MAG: methyltransferase [Anaeromyxobacteraceae bacterium]